MVLLVFIVVFAYFYDLVSVSSYIYLLRFVCVSTSIDNLRLNIVFKDDGLARYLRPKKYCRHCDELDPTAVRTDDKYVLLKRN